MESVKMGCNGGCFKVGHQGHTAKGWSVKVSVRLVSKRGGEGGYDGRFGNWGGPRDKRQCIALVPSTAPVTKRKNSVSVYFANSF